MSHLALARLLGLCPAVLVGAYLVFLNVLGHHGDFQRRGAWGGPNEWRAYGWPWAFFAEDKYLENEGAVFSDGGSLGNPRAEPIWNTKYRFEANYFFVDVAIGTLAVLVIWLVSSVGYARWRTA